MNYPTTATPTAVIVYPDRARVQCSGEVDLEAGSHRLLLQELPLTLEPDSVRVSGKGTAVLQIVSVDVQKQFFEDAPQQKVRDLEQQIDALNEQLREIADQKDSWEAHGRYLEGMRQATGEFAKGIAKGTSSVEDQVAVIKFLQEQEGELKTAVRTLDGDAKQINKQLDKLTLELNQLSRRRKKELYQAVVEIEVRTAGSFTPEVSYMVRQAGWRPLYDVRLHTVDVPIPTLELTTLAEIIQRTGQDWEGVDLSVSTARPALNQRLPKLKPWYVDVYRQPPQPAPKMAVRAMAQPMATRSEPEAGAAPMMDAMMKEQEAEVVVAQAVDSGTAVRFTIGGDSDVPSDGTPHKTTLSQSRSEPKLDYLAVPKHTDAIFRRAEIANKTGAPLLTGSANLFVDDEFIGKTKLPFTAQDDTVELLFGVEDRITVSRELVRRDVDKKMLSDVRRIRYAYEIELHNLMNTAVAVELKDHIPISRNEQIKIKLNRVSPETTETSDLNELKWALSLGIQQKTTIKYEFNAEYPRTLQVVGLP